MDYRYFERPYFLTPADQFAMEGYVVRTALRKTGKAGLGHPRDLQGLDLDCGEPMRCLRYAYLPWVHNRTTNRSCLDTDVHRRQQMTLSGFSR